MSQSKHLQAVQDEITAKRGYSAHFKKGAVMLKCRACLVPDSKKTYAEDLDDFLHDIDVYYPKNKNHFWMGKVTDPHITMHHGFELKCYEELGEEGEGEFTKDINEVIDALDAEDAEKNPKRTAPFRERLLYGTMKAEPSFFGANPLTVAAGEDNYYTVLLSTQPTAEMMEFRNGLLRVFPHTSMFPDWKVHVTIATVPDEKSRDALLAKLKDCEVKVEGLKIGYNIKRD